MTQYETLDAAILDRIKDGHVFWIFLCTGAVRDEAERLAAATGRDSYRILDARLQKLRKAGMIQYGSRVGWTLVSQQLKG